MSYQLHPLCTLFPRMSGADFAALVADIRANGLRDPITIHDGMILDGGNRIRACHEAGIEPHFREFEGDSIVAYVLSMNLHRRHMTPGQQAAIVASAQDWAAQAASGSNQHKAENEGGQSCPPSELDTRAKRAAASGASERTQKMADKVAKADPDLSRQVARGEKTLPEAIEQITGKRPGAKPAKQQEPDDNHYDPHEEELEVAHETIRELAAENEALKDRLAAELMPGCEEDKTAAIKTIQELRARVVVLEAELDAVKASRDGFMREAAAMKQQLKMQRNEIDKLKGQNRG